MDKKDILAKIRKIEIKTKSISKHILSGEYHSAFKGRGMSFSEVRGYQYGDDVRNIDWNVTARSNETHIKVFEEEREMTMMLLIDVSKSALFGSQEKPKNELIAELAALLAFSAMNNNDKVGAILFTDKIEQYIPPKKGRKNIMRIIMTVLSQKENTAQSTDINMVLEYLSHVQKRKAIVFLVSDYITDTFEKGLSIAASKHDLIGLHVYDQLEREIPNLGLIRMVDPETGKKTWFNTLFRRNRKKYAQAFDHRINGYKQDFKRKGAGFISLNTEDDYVKSLVKYFKSRG